MIACAVRHLNRGATLLRSHEYTVRLPADLTHRAARLLMSRPRKPEQSGESRESDEWRAESGTQAAGGQESSINEGK